MTENMDKGIIKLDKLDRKILYELDLNARQSLSELSKKLKKSRTVIDYRIRQLQKKKLITNFVTLLDAGKLGLMVWNVYLEFQNIDKEIEKKIIEHLVNNRKIWWVAKTTGNWNLIYSICVKDVEEFYNNVAEFNIKFGPYILRQSLAAHVDIIYMNRGYFINKPGISKKWYILDKVHLDETDKKILSKLAINARMPSTEIAQKINSTARIVSYRIKELLNKGVISRFRLQPDVSKIGYGYYKAIFHLKDYSKKKDSALLEYCRQLVYVMHYERKIGPWMLEMEMDCKSYQHFTETLRTMKEKFSDFIQSYEEMLIYEEPKGELDLTKVI